MKYGELIQSNYRDIEYELLKNTVDMGNYNNNIIFEVQVDENITFDNISSLYRFQKLRLLRRHSIIENIRILWDARLRTIKWIMYLVFFVKCI